MSNIVDRLTKDISRFPSVEKIILYGSRARGDAEERSDIDIAVVCPNATDREWVDIWCVVDDAQTLLSIDLVRLDTASEKLRGNVLREGKVLYERTSAPPIHEELEQRT
jgi:predicted nucleotidyltransferase